MGRGILGLAAFFIVAGIAFTLMAPGGLGEPTIVLGVIVALAAMFPENWISGLAGKSWRWVAAVMLVAGGIVTILDWGLALGKAWDVISVVLFFGGFAVLLLHALAYWRIQSENEAAAEAAGEVAVDVEDASYEVPEADGVTHPEAR